MRKACHLKILKCLKAFVPFVVKKDVIVNRNPKTIKKLLNIHFPQPIKMFFRNFVQRKVLLL
ncbi:MAG TPA: hypothetical protein DIT10_16105 [Chryseobacterium sp.]|nr:hypothetical protein [Chryseobacterium sp.]